MRRRPRSSLVLGALLCAALLAPAAGCARDARSGDGPVVLTVGVFGAFGMKEAGLYAEYERLRPGVRIRQSSVERNENYYPQLLTRLSTGGGLADVQAVEVSNIAEVTATQADRLVDLGRVPGVDPGHWLPWKAAQGRTATGALVALGTDTGPQAVCYRRDLFAAAGLPTDREAVGALWAGGWEAYLAVGRRYRDAAGRRAGTAFTDSAAGVMAAVHGSAPIRFHDGAGRPVHASDPRVRAAFDLAARFSREGLTARLQQFTPAWDRGFARARFATVSCPAWMLGYIADKTGPAGKGRWDVAAAPRPGNWGGSFLVVPRAGAHRAEAARLAVWLTAPAQQARLFAARGSFPSSRPALRRPEVAGARHPWFSDAPIGRIFGAAAEGVPVQPVGAKDLLIAKSLADVGMLRVERRGATAETGWRAAVRAIDNALDR
ncbi:ABC transporter substrate-binding protein [Streptomyces sp. BI20]|uniref:ABC transporter substrate-binding protein n=1 Tax=Streptomyces sp. BI20 TaxID=3403460 RepID=UPI003C77F2D4